MIVLLGARRVVERNYTAYRRQWYVFASGFAEPLLYLLSIGIGVGELVGKVPGPGGHLVGRLHEAAYVAVGLMVAAHVALVLYAGWLYRENLPACMVTGTYQAPAHEAIAPEIIITPRR